MRGLRDEADEIAALGVRPRETRPVAELLPGAYGADAGETNPKGVLVFDGAALRARPGRREPRP